MDQSLDIISTGKLTQYVQGILTILSLVNPVICAVIFFTSQRR
jgi:hypothetical protein